MNKIFLLGVQTLKENSAVNANVSDEYILPCIAEAQYSGLMPLIGKCLYSKLCSLVASTEIELPENEPYKTLLDDYVVPYLIQKTQSELQLTIGFKIRNAGPVQNSDAEHYSNADLRTIQYLQQSYLDKSNTVAHRLERFLCKHRSDYPELCNCNDCSEVIRNPKAYKTNINL